jgi:phosphotransferase system HPr (HPr) family protein
MITKTVITSVGFHARPVTYIVNEAFQYEADIWLKTKGQKYNAKSIMAVMSMGTAEGEPVTIYIDGEDEQKAMEAMVKLIETELKKVEQ